MSKGRVGFLAVFADGIEDGQKPERRVGVHGKGVGL